MPQKPKLKPEPEPEPISESIRITGPECWVIDRHYEPGETATVPADIAAEWKLSERARDLAEDEN